MKDSTSYSLRPNPGLGRRGAPGQPFAPSSFPTPEQSTTLDHYRTQIFPDINFDLIPPTWPGVEALIPFLS